MVEGLLYAQGWTEDDVEEAALVFTELIQNAIEHGSRADGTEHAAVEILLSEDAVQMEILDPGTGQAPAELLERDVTQRVPLDEPRGRGLFLVNRLAKEFERAPREAGGCRVRVRLEVEGA
jgi:anti-sigma regulatory factor (Ser/Thr protein kinase)